MNMRQNSIWLQGPRYNEAYLFDTTTGQATEYKTQDHVGTTAGNGSHMGRKLVATYVEADRQGVVLQIGTMKIPLDGATKATSRVHAVGLYSTLTIERDGHQLIKLRQRTLGRLFFSIIDPTYDGLDEMADDQTDGIAEFANSEESRANYLKVKDHEAGPWYLLDEDRN